MSRAIAFRTFWGLLNGFQPPGEFGISLDEGHALLTQFLLVLVSFLNIGEHSPVHRLSPKQRLQIFTAAPKPIHYPHSGLASGLTCFTSDDARIGQVQAFLQKCEIAVFTISA